MDLREYDWVNFVADLPVAISFIGGRYLIFDVKAVSYLRREHKLCGYNIGTLPQSPSQNVFLGLPTLIMPEEAQLLIDKGLGYLVDDARAHDRAVYNRNQAKRADFMAKVERQAREVEKMRAQEQVTAKHRALGRKASKGKGKEQPDSPTNPESLLDFDEDNGPASPASPEPSSPRNSTQDTPIKLVNNPAFAATYYVTPTTSRLLLPSRSPENTSSVQTKPISNLPRSYPLFRHLHDRDYFMTPGLRFGCQYTVYPGDPLRFHSHFLAVGVEWEEEIDMMEIVAGGRLGTGVKKAFLIGGQEKNEVHHATDTNDNECEPKVRTFSVEWAVM